MRGDDKKNLDGFRASKEWKRNDVTGETNSDMDRRVSQGTEIVGGKMRVHSFSGNERNHFFLNRNRGEEFMDLSALSGLDSVSDSRGLAFFDYDHDGWQDVVVVNANPPLTQLYRNNISLIRDQSKARDGIIAIRFEGANATNSPSKWSNRDGYGARVEVLLENGVKITREHLCGQGYASQSSATMIVGIGKNEKVSAVSVRWPSGKKTVINDVAEGTLLTAYENRETGAFMLETYRPDQAIITRSIKKPKLSIAKTHPGKIQVYTTSATWCAACIKHLPELAHLKENGVILYGVPMDEGDTKEKLVNYVAKKNPPYEMLYELSESDRKAVNEVLKVELQKQNPVLPSSIITDENGYVLEVLQGVPTLSQVRRWMQK